MTDLNTFQVRVITMDVENAGTDGDVYLGLCGREFFLDTSENNFERASQNVFTFGTGANVNNRSNNDPRNPQLRVEDADRFPVYIRFNPFIGGQVFSDWNLAEAEFILNGNRALHWDTKPIVDTSEGIWLGRRAGLMLHLLRAPF